MSWTADVDYSSNDNQCVQIISLDFYPFLLFSQKKGKPAFKGMQMLILNEVAALYNFCYNMTYAGRIGYGQYLEANNTYDGMVGLLVNKNSKYNFSITPIIYTDDRLRNFELSESMGFLSSAIAYKYPQIEPDIAGFIKPFSWQLWILLALTLVGVFVGLYLVSRLDKSLLQKTGNEKKEEPFSESFLEPLSKIFITCFKIVFGQALQIMSNLPSNYMLMAFFILTTLILGLSYKSNLVALLTLPKVNMPFRNVAELANQDKIGWTVPNGVVFYQIIKGSPNGSLFRKLYDGLKEPIVTPADAYEAIDKKGLAIILAEQSALGYVEDAFTKNGYCTRTMLPETFFPRVMGMMFKKNSSYVSMYSRVITSFKEAGIMDMMLSRSLTNSSYCIGNYGGSKKDSNRPLALGDFIGVFVVLAGGLSFATITFLLELMVNKLHLHSNKTPAKSYEGDKN